MDVLDPDSIEKDGNCILVAEEAPEHVPIRISRLACVALVADGRGKQAISLCAGS
jgi:hypothetical protein